MKATVEHAEAIGPWGRGVDALAAWLSAAVLARGGDPPDPPAVLARGGDPPDPPAVLARGDDPPDPPPNVPGFMKSPFINYAYAAQADCLRRDRVSEGATATGIVMASVLGDTVTADMASTAVAAGEMPLPLLFYQSVPSAVLGKMTAELPITGPLVCLSGGAELFAEAREAAELMLGEDVDHVLLTYVEAGGGRWRAAAARALAQLWGEPVVPPWDCAVSVLLGSGAGTPSADSTPPGGLRDLPRPLRDFAELALAGRQARPAQQEPSSYVDQLAGRSDH